MGDKNRLPDVFNTEQLVKLFDAVDRPKVAIAAALGFFCGLRISEACRLRVEDLDLERNTLKIVDGKNSRRKFSGYGKDRYVPIPPQLISPLKKWIEIINGGKWLIPSDKSPDTHIQKKSLHEQFREVLKNAGLLVPKFDMEFQARIHGKKAQKKCTRHKYSFHTLRHAYATYLRDKGVDIYTISDLLGHSQVTTTQIYARISDTQRKKAVNEAFNLPLRSQIVTIQPQQPHSIEEKMIELKKLELEVKKLELMQRRE